MALEAGDGFISGLVITNPVNASDQVAQGDDHLRLIKTALKGTFPNLNGEVTATPAELNILDGATLSTAELNILDGVTLTASQINDAARQSAANTFTSQSGLVASNSAPQLRLLETGVTANNGNWIVIANNEQLQFRAYDDAISGNNAAILIDRTGTTIDQVQLLGTEIDLVCTTLDLNGNLDCSGTVTTPGTSAAEVGYSGTPLNTQDGNYTLVLGDRGKTIYKNAGGAGETITIPANASVAFPVGTQIDIVNNGGGALTIAITSDTLSWVVSGTTGSRTLSDHGWCVLKKITSTEWFISGAGLT